MQVTTTYACGHKVTTKVDGRDARYKHVKAFNGQMGSRDKCYTCRNGRLETIIRCLTLEQCQDILREVMSMRHVEDVILDAVNEPIDTPAADDCKDCGHGHRPGTVCENRHCLCEGQ